MPQNLALAAAAIAFLAVALLSGAMTFVVLERRAPTRKRLEGIAGTGATGVVPVATTLLVEQPPPNVQRVTRFIPKSPTDMSRLQKRLARAGSHSAYGPVLFSSLELGLPVLVATLVVYFGGTGKNLVLAAIAAIIAYLVPGFVLSAKIEKRKKQISHGLPDALDLLIVCVEAGLGLDQAVLKASEELDVSHPALAEELKMLTIETRAGKPRLEAFRNFADRTKVEDVRLLVSMLTQTDRFGTSVAQALRTFSETLRTKRRQDAEERAAKLGVKLVFPLVFCLFPALYVVTLGPAIIQFVRVFFGQVMQR